MKNIVMRLWRDEAGFVVSTELVLIATIVVIGMVTGLTTVRDAVVTELADVADAVAQVDQSYSFGAITAHCASTAGSEFFDMNDFCDTDDPEGVQGLGNGGGQCVAICLAPVGGETD
jgi:Flp pilus assembly pilin Flp